MVCFGLLGKTFSKLYLFHMLLMVTLNNSHR